MFMATKTLTIMEDTYEMLLRNKMENESFSDVIRRIISRKGRKSFSDLFGILSNEEGDAIAKNLKKAKAMEVKLLKERMKNENIR
jgi:predicted CopG family antitoxin